ncbi:hypothetical protein COY23_04110 [bacterium (Candidatus Torokbacteria) CG_4_10_14_0_2_um_filter_35_8]|nr:MAG: hypothetical protein COY23_04110 [bacterium (Candidatus Torokbacteria) CG_4_10_14_0_2_um_filter_35_8]
MLELNLLPPEQKKELEFEKTYNFGISIVVIIFFLTGVVLAATFGIQLILETNNQVLNEEQIKSTKERVETEEYKTLTDNIENANKKIDFISELGKNQRSTYKLISEINRLLPSYISVTSITFDWKERTVSMSGKAKTREQFLLFKESLENSQKLKDIKSPLSNLEKEKDLTFQIEATIKEKDE